MALINRDGRKGRNHMNSSRGTLYHPSLKPASLSGKAFLITAEEGALQRSRLPPNWLVVRVNPVSVEAMERAVSQPFAAEDEAVGRELPY